MVTGRIARDAARHFQKEGMGGHEKSLDITAALVLPTGLIVLVRPISALAQDLDPDVSMVALGKIRFQNIRLSVNGTQSCVTCHTPEVGFTGPDALVNSGGAVFPGSAAQPLWKSQTACLALRRRQPGAFYNETLGAWFGGMFGDGRATGATLHAHSPNKPRGRSLIHWRGMMGSSLPMGAAFDVLTVNVVRKASTQPVLGSLPDLTEHFDAGNEPNFEVPRPFTLEMSRMVCTINGRVFEMMATAEDEMLNNNETMSWKWINNSPIPHPMMPGIQCKMLPAPCRKKETKRPG